jgi:hypothetical protein
VPEASGVPLSVAVPLPLSTNVSPLGNAPVSVIDGVGDPVVVIVNEPATPTVKVPPFALVIAAAVPTVRVAVAALPVPPLVELIVPVVLVTGPRAVAVTFTERTQEELAATVAAVSETLPDPATAVTTPPQVLANPFGVATTIPAGNASVNATPVRPTVFATGFVIVNVNEVDALNPMLAAPNTFAIEGGASTVTLAEAVPPVPP